MSSLLRKAVRTLRLCLWAAAAVPLAACSWWGAAAPTRPSQPDAPDTAAAAPASAPAPRRVRVDPRAANGEFRAHWDSRWMASDSGGECRLTLEVPRYGLVQFLGGAAGADRRTLDFELRDSRDLMAPRAISWRRRAPAWHPRHPQLDDWAAIIAVPGFGGRVGGPTAETMALGLYAGFEIDLAAAGARGQQPAVFLNVSALGFRPAYDDFRRCQESGLPASLMALRRSRILFETGSHRLSPRDREQLRSLAAYIQADPDIGQVYVDGHTDAVGSERDNVALSRRRAQAVFDVLVQAGVEPAQLVLRYHGERYPVQRGQDGEPMASNRRATVRVEMRSPSIAQQ